MSTRTLTRAERKEIASNAEDQAAELEDVTVLTLEELEALDLDGLRAYFAAHGIPVDVDRIEAQVRLELGEDVVDLDRGRLDDASRARLEGKIKKATLKAARTLARQSIREATRTAMESDDPRDARDRYSIWVSVGEGACDSCVSRHGIVDSADSWEGDAPGEGSTLCKSNCRCRLIPVKKQPTRDDEGTRFDND